VRTTIQSLEDSDEAAAMCHMALFNAKYRVLLIASLISSCLLMGCESNFDRFERFYQPAATREGAPSVTLQPGATPPRLVYSHDPDTDGRLLRQHGYVLIGTASFYGAPDLSYADSAVAQGQSVGAAILLLKAPSYSVTSCCRLDESIQVVSGGDGFASYWAKSDPANTSGSN
jgi:hypothetical protein